MRRLLDRVAFAGLLTAAGAACEDETGRLNQPPIADAGPDLEVLAGASFTLDGTGSQDPDGRIEGFLWVQSQGGPVDLSNPDAARVELVAPDESAVLRFTLIVTDDRGRSDDDEVTVTVSGSSPPVADAGPDLDTVVGATVRLDGRASSDPEGDIVSHRWAQTAGEIVSLDDPATPTPSFVAPPVLGRLGFELTVTDAAGNSDSDDVQVFVSENQPPVADAGPDATGRRGETVPLDGSGSFDPDGRIETFEWTVRGDPEVPIPSRDQAIARLTLPATGGPLEVELRVVDDRGAAATDRMRVVPVGQPPRIVVTFPTENGDFEGRVEEATVRGTVVDPDGGDIESVEVNGVPATLEAASGDGRADSLWWSARVPMSPGSSVLTVTATDEGQETASVQRAVQNQPRFRDPLDVSVSPDGRRILVLDEGAGLLELDRASGDRRVVNDLQGAPFTNPTAVVYDETGNAAFVADETAEAIFRVELSTGSATVFSAEGSGVGTGPRLWQPIGLALDPDRDRLLVYHQAFGILLAVDLQTGDRTEIIRGSPDFVGGEQMFVDSDRDRLILGNGFDVTVLELSTQQSRFVPRTPSSEPFGGLGVEPATGRVLLSGRTLRRVDLETGRQTALSGDSLPSMPVDFAIEPGGNRNGLVLGADAVLRVDLATGRHSDDVPVRQVGSGEALRGLTGLAWAESSRRLWALDRRPDLGRYVYAIDPDVGDRVRVAGPIQDGFRGPEVMSWDPNDQVLLLGDSGGCTLERLDPTSGDLEPISTEVCPQAIAVPDGGRVAYVSNWDSRPLFGTIRGIYSVDLETGVAAEVSGPNRGAGVPFLNPSPPGLFVDPAGGGLLVLDQGVWSVELPTGDRAPVLTGGFIGDAAVGAIDGRFRRGLLAVDVRERLLAVDLDAGRVFDPIPVPGFGSEVVVDAEFRRAFFGRSDFVSGSASIVAIDLESGEWVASSK